MTPSPARHRLFASIGLLAGFLVVSAAAETAPAEKVVSDLVEETAAPPAPDPRPDDLRREDPDEDEPDENDPDEREQDEGEQDEGEPGDAETEDLVSTDPDPDPDHDPEPEPEANACLSALETRPVVFSRRDPIEGEGDCGMPAPLEVSEIDGIRLTGPAIVNCATATALVDLMTLDAVPAAREHLGDALRTVAIGSSYVCRPRNGRPGAKLSEHATGNGVDLTGFGFEGRSVPVSAVDPTLPEARFLADVRAAACERFATVLGPGSDAAHADHFHLDLRARKNDYRICQ